MNIYVSAPIPWLPRARILVDALRMRGYTVVSTWHEREFLGYARSDKDLGADAMMDISESKLADIMVAFSLDGSNGGVAGEMAIGIARGIPVWAIGDKLSIWSYHPSVEWFKDEVELLTNLGLC